MEDENFLSRLNKDRDVNALVFFINSTNSKTH